MFELTLISSNAKIIENYRKFKGDWENLIVNLFNASKKSSFERRIAEASQ